MGQRRIWPMAAGLGWELLLAWGFALYLLPLSCRAVGCRSRATCVGGLTKQSRAKESEEEQGRS